MGKPYSEPTFDLFVASAMKAYTLLAEDSASNLGRYRPETGMAISNMASLGDRAAYYFRRRPELSRPGHMQELFDAFTNVGMREAVAARHCIEVEGLRQASGRNIDRPLLDRRSPSEPALHRWWNDIANIGEFRGGMQELVFGGGRMMSLVTPSLSGPSSLTD